MTKKLLAVTAAISATAMLAACGGAQNASRDQIRAVGSSTVLPFAKLVSEEFAKGGTFKAPIIEGNGTGGGHMPTELNDKPFVTGSLGVARGGDISISNDSQFFITKSDASWLNHQYTNFGMVTEGMDVVDKIQIGDKIKSITINQ